MEKGWLKVGAKVTVVFGDNLTMLSGTIVSLESNMGRFLLETHRTRTGKPGARVHVQNYAYVREDR